MKLVAVVLAAGRAVRFGGDKMSAVLSGLPLLHHAVIAARAAPVERVIVVTRPGIDVGEWAGSPPVETIRLVSDALSDSLKTGIREADGADGAFVFLGDMPAVSHLEAHRLAAGIADSYAAMPVIDGRPGHPVLLSARAFPDICALSGDQGAGRLLNKRADVFRTQCADASAQRDVDRPEDLERWTSRQAD